MIIRRFSSNGVPAKRRTGGKKSLIDGPVNPPPSEVAAAMMEAT
jgi:hypothetical protein